jgi:hypothetical protein
MLQQTGHPNDGLSCFNGSFRVSRLLTDSSEWEVESDVVQHT